MSRLPDNCAGKSKLENVLAIHDLPSEMYNNRQDTFVGRYIYPIMGWANQKCFGLHCEAVL